MREHHPAGPMVTAIVISACLFLLAQPAYAEKTLADYKALFEGAMSRISTTRGASRKAALDAYGKKLEAAKRKLMDTGNLDGTIAIGREIERLNREKTVSQTPPDGGPSLLLALHKNYHSAVHAAEYTRSKSSVELIKQYMAPLKRLKTKLVQHQKLDDAGKVAAELRRARFLLADYESKLPVRAAAPAKQVAAAGQGRIDLTTIRPVGKEAYCFRVNRVPHSYELPVIDGKPAGRYFLAAAPSSLTFRIGLKHTRFTARAALWHREGRVKFIVKVDNNTVYTSPAMRGKRVVDVKIDLPHGGRKLQLIVNPLGSNRCDHSFWINPVIE